MLGIELNIIGHILLAYRQLGLDNGMTSGLYLQHTIVAYYRAHIAMLLGCFGKGEHTVETGYDVGIYLYLWNKLGHISNEFHEETCLKRENLLVGSHYLLLIFLKLLGDVALGIGKCLLAYPLLWHLVFVCVAHFEVIAKHIIISYLKALYACLLSFFFLNL